MRRFAAVVAVTTFVAIAVAGPTDAAVPSFAVRLGGQTTSTAVATDAAGNIYVTGIFSGTVDLDPGPANLPVVGAGQTDVYILKISSTGTLIWAKTIASTTSETSTGIAIDPEGSVYVSGFFFAGVAVDFDPGPSTFPMTSAGDFDGFALALDADGDFVLAHQLGDINTDYYTDVAVDDLGDVLFVGTFDGTVDFDPDNVSTHPLTASGPSDVFVQKLNSDGDFVWAHRGGSAGSENGADIAVDSGGGAIVTGSFSGTADFNPGGTFNLISSGGTDGFVWRLDSSGNFKWAIARGSSESIEFMSGVAVFGNKVYAVGALGRASLARLDLATGDVLYTRNWGDSTVSASAVAVDGAGVHVVGTLFGTADLDPGPAVRSFDSGAGTDAFRSVFTRDGTLLEAGTLAGGSSDPFAIALAPETIVGHFAGTIDFDPGAGVLNLSSEPSITNAFTLKLVDDPKITINNVRTTEGDGARKNFTFRVRIDKAVAVPVSVGFTTANGTARSGSDYVVKTGTVVIPAGQLSKTFSIAVVGGQVREANETFQVRLRSPVSGVIADGTGVATIVNDD